MRVLIAGATSAVAQAVMQQYAAQGAQLYCLARNAQKLQQQLQQNGIAVAGSYCFDFNDLAQAETAVQQAVQVLGGIDIALIAHGTLPDQLQTERDIKQVQATVNDNMLSAIALVQAIGCVLQQQGSGKLGVISSVAGDRGRPRNFTYGAAKAGLSVYLQGMRSVLWRSGVELYTFKLGPVDTPMTADHAKNFSFTNADTAARCMVQAFQRRRYQVYVPGFWRYVMWVVRWLPEPVFQRLRFLSAR